MDPLHKAKSTSPSITTTATEPVQPVTDSAPTENDGSGLLTPKSTARFLGIGTGLLRAWRDAAAGPRHYVFGPKSIRYRLADIEAFLDSCAIGSAP